jgi:hypothetical protein
MSRRGLPMHRIGFHCATSHDSRSHHSHHHLLAHIITISQAPLPIITIITTIITTTNLTHIIIIVECRAVEGIHESLLEGDRRVLARVGPHGRLEHLAARVALPPHLPRVGRKKVKPQPHLQQGEASIALLIYLQETSQSSLGMLINIHTHIHMAARRSVAPRPGRCLPSGPQPCTRHSPR